MVILEFIILTKTGLFSLLSSPRNFLFFKISTNCSYYKVKDYLKFCKITITMTIRLINLVSRKKEKPIGRNSYGTISSTFFFCEDMFTHVPLFLPFYLLFVPKAVGFCCSPYSTTILLSTPQHGKLTVKADLIFEEYSKLLLD